jgi:hypothetical protein
MGSFIMMNQRARPERNVNGSVTQTLDILDFSVIHLSWYERLQRRHAKLIDGARKGAKKDKKTAPKDVAEDSLRSIAAIETANKLLKRRALKMRHPAVPFVIPEVNRTVAIMPFLGSENGAGHSKLGNRLVYLQACFWSIYADIPHIVAYVKNNKDADFAR